MTDKVNFHKEGMACIDRVNAAGGDLEDVLLIGMGLVEIAFRSMQLNGLPVDIVKVTGDIVGLGQAYHAALAKLNEQQKIMSN